MKNTILLLAFAAAFAPTAAAASGASLAAPAAVHPTDSASAKKPEAAGPAVPYLPARGIGSPYYRRLKALAEDVQTLELELQKAQIEARIASAKNSIAANRQKAIAEQQKTLASANGNPAQLLALKDAVALLQLELSKARLEAEIAAQNASKAHADLSAKSGEAQDPKIARLRRDLLEAQIEASIAEAIDKRTKFERGGRRQDAPSLGLPASIAPRFAAKPQSGGAPTIDAILGRGRKILALLRMPDGTGVHAILGATLPNGAKVAEIDGNGVTVTVRGRERRLGFTAPLPPKKQRSSRRFPFARPIPIRPPVINRPPAAFHPPAGKTAPGAPRPGNPAQGGQGWRSSKN